MEPHIAKALPARPRWLPAVSKCCKCLGDVITVREVTRAHGESTLHPRTHSRATQAEPLGDDAQIAKSGELPLKALVRVDAIRKACLTNLDCALDCLFTEVEHPVHERPVCNLVVGRGMQAIAGNQ